MCVFGKGMTRGGGDPKQVLTILFPRRAWSGIRKVDCSSCGEGDGGERTAGKEMVPVGCASSVHRGLVF